MKCFILVIKKSKGNEGLDFKESAWGQFPFGGSGSGALVEDGGDPAPSLSSAGEDLNTFVLFPRKVC